VSLLDSLRLPDPPRIVFEQSPLVLALCQVRFSRVLAIASPAYVAPFQRAIQAEYPILRPAPDFQVEIGVGPEVSIQQGMPAPQWRFSDTSGNWTVVLSESFLSIETRRYDDFEDFLRRLRSLLDHLDEIYQPIVVTRIGLRYINEVRLNGRHWSNVVRPDLLGPLSLQEVAEHVERSIQELVMSFPEDESVRIRHGRLPSGSTVQVTQGEQPPQGPFYLLDFDVARTFSQPTVFEMDPEAVCGYVDEYHRVIHQLFRWSLRPEFTDSLGVRRYAD
jgi:uncharacterized protein (TIGR04255 family)